MTDLSPVERIAIAGAFKGKQLDQDKASLADGSAASVDVTVRVCGEVQKGSGTPSSSYTFKPSVNLRSWGVLCAMLKLLGIGAKRLAAVAAVVPSDAKADADLEAVLTAEEQTRKDKQPDQTGTNPAKAGAVQSQAVTKVE